ncbi:MAG: asparaginase [Roseburia sp.]|nr:asparaginase [Roseburia sp.]
MKINLVATGGTIGSRLDGDGAIVISDAATAQIADIIGANEVFSQFKIHSAGIGFGDFFKLKGIIERAAVGADGVIVTHGTDTLAFLSAYLAYAFCDTGIPIVLCAADEPLTDDYSNGFDVLNAAKSFIAQKRSGVYVMYKNPGAVVRIHHGARLVPAHMHEDFYFSIGNSTFSDTGVMHGMDFDLQSVENTVLCVLPYVGMNYAAYDMRGYKAVVQVAYHSGRVNAGEFDKFASRYPDIPIYLTAGRKKYGDGELAPNVIQCHGITQTALYVKLLIGVKNNVKDLTAFVKKNACGEIVKER